MPSPLAPSSGISCENKNAAHIRRLRRGERLQNLSAASSLATQPPCSASRLVALSSAPDAIHNYMLFTVAPRRACAIIPFLPRIIETDKMPGCHQRHSGTRTRPVGGNYVRQQKAL